MTPFKSNLASLDVCALKCFPKQTTIFKCLAWTSNQNMKSLFRLIRPAFHVVTRLSSRASNSFAVRSHTCGELRKSDAGRKVKLCGWVQHQRLNKFVVLRDAYGVTQLVVPAQRTDLAARIRDAPLESVVSADGEVCERPQGQANPKQATGEIEVLLDDIQILSTATPNLPFNIQDIPKVKEPVRLEYRYLNFRDSELQRNLRLRSDVVMKMREYLVGQSFVDVETPTLFRRTPGGAQEFVVPTRTPGKFYSLVQSPQQFKQLLMIGGLDRYFQIARCYRDEGTKPARQPEFTQVDIEMSFTTKEHIQRLIENLLLHAWPAELGTLQLPFAEMKYEDALNNYGVDKPDTRFGNLLQDVTDIVKASEISHLFDSSRQADFAAIALTFKDCSKLVSKAHQEALITTAKETKRNAKLTFIPIRIEDNNKWKSSLSKKLSQHTMQLVNERLNTSANDVVWLGLGSRESLVPCMGKLRLEMANHLEDHGLRLRSDGFNFLWVVDFPLFLPSDDGESIESTHHPFTAPHPDDEHLVKSDPLQVRGQHYDLVLNGSEIGGGSVRIHQSDLQEYVLKEVLNEDPSTLAHLIEALRCGAPPHGGIALGLDRLIAIMCRTKSIRDVIAFPKANEGKDLMSDAPAAISQKEKELYHIDVANKK